MRASYDGFTYETDDSVVCDHIAIGRAEPYLVQLPIVKRYLHMFPDKNRCYIDVGAHIGTTVAPYSRLYQTVHAYEPCERNANFLRQNVAANNIANCTIHTEGAYSKTCNGTMKLHGGGNSGCYYFETDSGGDVRVIALDSQGHTEVDFIKIDTEGSELYVLQGAEQTLRRWKPMVQFECNSLSEKFYGIRESEMVEYMKSLGYLAFDTSDPNNRCFYCPDVRRQVVCFWTGTNTMSEARQRCLAQMTNAIGVPVVCVTPETLDRYILPAYPLHPGFQYLSEVHKCDYLRTYFMNFYGGGYSDIKEATTSWTEQFDVFMKSDSWVCGYPEIHGGVAYPPYASEWAQLVGNCAYICKPNTPFTNEWYAAMMALMDSKLDALRQHPATSTRDCAELGSGYPIEWNEMLGRIFHKISFKYKEKLMRTLPMPRFDSYM